MGRKALSSSPMFPAMDTRLEKQKAESRGIYKSERL